MTSISRRRTPHFLASRICSLLPSLGILLTAGGGCLEAAPLYWDTNGITAGSGNAAGTWDTTTANWSTDSIGASATTTWLDGSDAIFSAGADGVGTKTVTLSGTFLTPLIKLEEVALVTLSGGTIDITGGSTFDTSSLGAVTNRSLTWNTNIVGTGPLTLRVNGDTSATGGGSSTIFALTGANTFVGDVSITSGVVGFSSSFGDAANKLILNGGGIVGNVTGTLARDLQIGSAPGTLRAYGAATLTLTGSFSNAAGVGSAVVNRTDGGNIIFTGSGAGFVGTYNNQAGTTTLGALNANFSGTDFNVAAGSLALTGGGTATVGSITTLGNVALSNNSVLDVASGNLTFAPTAGNGVTVSGGATSAITSSGSTLLVTSGAASGTMSANEQFIQLIVKNFNGSTPLSLVKSNVNSVTLDQANTYTGGTVIAGGRLNASHQSAFGTGSVSVLSGGEAFLSQAVTYANNFTIAGTGVTEAAGILGALRFNPNSVVSGNVTVGAGGARMVAYSGAAGTLTGNLIGTDALEINGSAALLNGTITHTGSGAGYTGTLTVAQGRFNSGTSLGGSIVVADGASLGGEAAVAGGVTLGTTTGTTLYINGATTGALGVAGTLTANGTTTVDFAKLPTVPGTVTILNYGTLAGSPTFALANAASYRSSAITVGAGTVTLAFDNKALTWTGTGGATWDVNTTSNWTDGAVAQKFFFGDAVTFGDTGAGTVTLAATGVQPSSITVASNAAYTFATGFIAGGTGLVKGGTGTLALNGANTFTGDVTITGGILQTGNASALGTVAGTTTISGGGTLDVNAQNLGFERIFVQGTGVGGNGAITNSSATAQQQAFRYITLTGDATIGGTGRWDLRGTVAGGGGNGETLDLGGFTLTKTGTNLVYGGVNATVTGGNIIVNQGTFGLWQSLVTGTGTITVNPAGTLEVNPLRATDFTRAITLAGGTLTAGGASGINSNVTLTANSTLNLANALTINGTLDQSGGSFGFNKNGTAALTLNGAATFTGALNVNAGSLLVGGATGALTGPQLSLTNAVAATIDNSTSFLANRFSTASGVSLSNGSILAIAGSATGNTAHTAGTLNVGSGISAVTLGTQTTSNTAISFTGLSTTPTSVLLVRAPNGLGDPQGNNTANLFFTTPPATVGTGINGGQTRPIISGAFAINGAGANFGTFLAYDTTKGAYPLGRNGTDYFQTTNFSGVALDQNVFVNGTATAPAGTSAFNSLFINIEDVAGNAAGATLKVNSGNVLVSDTSATKTFTLGTGIAANPLTLDFNGQTGFLTLASSTNFQASAGDQNTGNREYAVNAKIDNVGANGLVISGLFGNVLGLHGKANTQSFTTIQGLNGVLAPSATAFQMNFDNDGALGTIGAGVLLNNVRLVLRGSAPEVAEAGVVVNVSRPLFLAENVTSTNITEALGADFSDELTWSGAVIGTANFSKVGAGRVVFTGAPAYTGTTTINGGVLQIGAGGTSGALPSTPIIINAANNVGASLVYARSDQTTVANAISGAGNVVVLGGTMNLGTTAAGNSYSGDTLVYGGTLRLAGGGFSVGSVIGTGKLIIYPGASVVTTTTHHFGNNNTTTNIAVLGGTLTTANAEFYFANLEMWGGTITGANELRAGASRTLNIYPSIGGSTIDRNYSVNAVGSNTATFYVNDGSAANDLTFSKSITTATSVLKAGLGTMRLTAASAYAGTTVLNGGVLKLDFANATPATNLIAAASLPTFAGGNLTITGKDNTANTQTLGNPTFNAGGSAITFAPGTGTGTAKLTLGNTWTRNTGATVNITLPTGATLTAAPTLTNNVVGYATVNGTDFATVTAGNVTSFGAYDPDDFSASTKNTNLTTATAAPVSAISVNSLRFGATAGTALTLPAGTNTIGTGGVLIPSTVTAATSIGGGNLTGSATDLVVHQFSAADLTISSVIPANGASGLTKTGPGKLILSGTNLYTGATQINGGTLEFTAAGNLGAAAAPITFGGGTLRWGSGTLDVTSGRTVTIGSGGGTFDVPTGTVTLATAFGTGSTGTLTKAGAGTLTISAANANFTGSVVVNAGTLIASNVTALGPNQTQAIIVNTGGTLNLGTNSLSANHTTAVARSLFINGGLVQNVSANTLRTGNIYLNGGTLQTQTGAAGYDSFYLGTQGANANGANAVVFVDGTTPSSILTTGSTTNNGLRLGPNVVFSVSDVTVSSAVDLTVTTPLGNQVTDLSSAPGAFTKRGAGTMLLAGASTFTGGVTLAQGGLQLRNSGALGSAGLTYLGDDSTGASNLSLLIEADGNGSYNIARNIYVGNYGTGTVTLGSLQTGVAGTAQSTFSGTITLAKDVIFQGSAQDRTQFIGLLTGAGNITINGGKRVGWDGTQTNDFTGNIAVEGSGTIFQLGFGTPRTDSLVPDTANVSVGAGATFRLTEGGPETIAGLSGSGVVEALVTASTLTVGAGNATRTFDGPLNNNGAALSLTKIGTGTLALTNAASTMTGATTVLGGTLLVNGSISGSSVSVNGGTLAGAGTVGATTLTSGTLTAGDSSIGALITGNLALNGGTLLFELSPGGTSDVLNVAGTVTFGGAVQLNLNFGADLPGGTAFTLINNNNSLDSIDLTGGGLFLGAGAITPGASFDYTSGGFTETFQLSYTGNDGNDAVLTVVPEPGTSLALLGGLGVLLARRRRRA